MIKKKPARAKKNPAKASPKKAASRGSSALDGSTILEVRSTVLFRKEQNLKVSILNLEDQITYQTTGIAACIWLMIDGKTSIAQIIAALKAGLRTDTGIANKAKKYFNEIFLKNLVQVISDRKSTKEISSPPMKLPFSPAELKCLRTMPGVKLEEIFLEHREVAAGSGTSLSSGFYTTSSGCGRG